jgi:hypothetical protein
MPRLIPPNNVWFSEHGGAIVEADQWPGPGWHWLRPGWAQRQNLPVVLAKVNAGEILENDPVYGLGTFRDVQDFAGEWLLPVRGNDSGGVEVNWKAVAVLGGVGLGAWLLLRRKR